MSASNLDSESERDRLSAIERMIESADSPVGIDAKKTHVLILRALERIEERLSSLERRVGIERRKS